jgi:hypothetical protein
LNKLDIVYQNKSWLHPLFNELVQDLQHKARELEKDYKDAICLKVFGIDFQKPA